MSTETREGLSTADLVPDRTSSRQIDPVRQESSDAAAMAGRDGARAAAETEQLAALFPPDAAQDFRQHWDQVQIGFVDDPQAAVRQADELVAQVMAHLARSFAEQRSRLESSLSGGGQADTEQLRTALRSYRSFFQRLLSL